MGKYPRIFSRLYLSGFDPLKLREKTLAIFGVGGIGSLLADMAVRVGIGTIIMVDKDTVEEENLNRMGFDIDDLGKPKVEAMADKLSKFKYVRGENFPIKIEKYYVNIFDFPELEKIVRSADCILVAFDDLEARLEVNALALKYRKVLIDGGTSTNGLRGRVTVVKPYETACLGCLYSPEMLIAEGNYEEYTCNVSLPTTMGLVACIQMDQCLRYLLGLSGIYSMIMLSLEDGIEITKIPNIKRREGCMYCSR